jgi:RNA polymerase sigma factor for flagellar operon FliA
MAQLADRRMREALVGAIKNLPEREQFVMSMYYEQDMNLREIAAVLGVTESRVCQLHSQSIARLRAKLRTW